jgi:hypothetical protein
LSGAFSAEAQTKNGRGRTVKTTNASNASTEPTARKTDFSFSAPENLALSASWASGELPQPLPVPEGSGDEYIAVLAEKIAAKNNESISALLAALQFSGFFITDKEGAPLHTPPNGRGQGLPINGWEAASAAKMFGDNRTVKLVELGDRLKSIPGFKQIDVGAALLEGLKANAENDKNPYLRNWARLIIELGKNSANKYDIAAGAAAEQIELDAIQHLLMMRRLYGDLWASAEKYKTAEVKQAPTRSAISEQLLRFYGASFSANNFSDAESASVQKADYKLTNNSLNADKAAQSKIPCRMDGNAPTVMDAGAAIADYGYGKFLGYLEDVYQGSPVETAIKKFGMYQAAANIVLAYAKFIHTYAALEVTLALAGEPPLVRTKDGAPGEQKQMQATVKMNIGNWQMYNCIRMAMNTTVGIDFATLNDGPIADVGVNWHINKGGGTDAIVGFAKNGAPRIQQKGTGAGVGTKGTRVGNLVYMKTDNKGKAEITIEGAPQKNYVKGRIMPVMKEASVHVTVKMKAGEIKGDMVDVAAQAIGGLPGLIAMPAELLYRADWFSSGNLSLPVKDWEYCEGGWQGRITRTTKYRKEKPTETRHTTTYTGYEEWTEKLELNVTGKSDTRANLKNGYFATGKITFDETTFDKRNNQKFSCTIGSGGSKTTKYGIMTNIHRRNNKADSPADTTVYVAVYPGYGYLDFSVPEIEGESFYKETTESPCPEVNKAGTRSGKEDYPLKRITKDVTEFKVEVDPKNPDVLNGTKTVKNSDGSESIYIWNLVRCGNSN